METTQQRLTNEIQAGVQVPAHRVQMGLNRLIEEGKLDQDGADAIFWFYSYGQDNNMTLAGLGEKIDMSASAVHSIIHCKYGAKLDGVIAAINRCRLKVEAAAKNKAIGFVQTETWKAISAACLSALKDGMTAFIYGESQLGKTASLLEFQRTHNHGTTKYLRMGSSWSKGRFVRELAHVCKCFNKNANIAELEDRIIGALNNRMLLIVDEFHLAIETTTDQRSKEIMEFIREVFDRTGVGLVMSSTKVGMADLENCKNKMLFDQLRRRGIVKVVLPDVPKVKDINTFARAFELEAPTGELLATIKQILKERGLGVFIKYLQKAYQVAKDANRPLAWDDFAMVNDGYAALANPRNDY